MKILKPTRFCVSFEYTCLECESTHWLRQEEVAAPGFKIICYCGITYDVETMQDLKLRYSNSNKEEESTTPKTDIVDKAISILMGQGFSKGESITLIKKVPNFNMFQDAASLVKKALQQL